MENKTHDSNETDKNKAHPKFDPEDLQKEFKELIEKKFGGSVQVLGIGESIPSMDDSVNEDQNDADFRKDLEGIYNFNFKPRELKKYLDRFVIGQDEAKIALSIAICDHYNHLTAGYREGEESEKDLQYQKQNVLILGPTGVGKTYLVRLISDLIGVPFVKADATRFSEVGYMGANVDDIIRDLFTKANGNKELAATGIVYVDEVDKLASRRDQMGRDVSGRGVQFGFLRLLENADVDLNASHDIASQFKNFMSFQKKGKAVKEIVNTCNILFIFSGAFHGLEDIINQRLNQKSIGLHNEKNEEEPGETLKKVEVRDLIQFGFEHEFVGRLPIRVACDNLSEKDLYDILTKSEHSIVNQYVQSFAHYGIKLRITDGALRQLAKEAHKQKTGARGLSAVFEETLRPFKFELPSTSIRELVVDEDLVKNPKGVLHHLVQSP